jgi:hypothetical protein
MCLGVHGRMISITTNAFGMTMGEASIGGIVK